MSAGATAKILYLLGAGRSGTTIVAAMLGAHDNISWHGELIHLANWNDSDHRCSCGEPLRDCPFWQSHDIAGTLGPGMAAAQEFETHRRVPLSLLLSRRYPGEYRDNQLSLLKSFTGNGRWLLDSSKYVGRALGLGSCSDLNVRYIYMVRDPRGVVYSFAKSVQTHRSLLNATFYYVVVNLMAQLAVWSRLRGRCLKLRYEDLASDLAGTTDKAGTFLGEDLGGIAGMVSDGRAFSADHVAGGNRWVIDGMTELKPDIEWRGKMGWGKRLLIYFLCLPFQLINRYGI